MYFGYGYIDSSRFYRNREPLITPQFASLAARRPLLLSYQLISVVNDLSSLLEDARAGKEVDKKSIEANTRQIRILAKAIRTDSSLEYLDMRAEKDLFKGVEIDQLGVGAIDRLREIANQLNSQLTGMIRQTQTAVISVDYLTQPSFTSLARGIEKLSQVIQNSTRRF
jgi:hypothetical protein